MPKSFYALLSASLLFNACNNTGNETTPVITEKVRARIDSTMKSFIDLNKTGGLSALIYEDGKEVYYNAFGFADREAGRPMDRNTIVQIFSMTKPIIGVALMTLWEKGLFQLDDSLAAYAPEFANMKVYKGLDENGNPVTESARRPILVRDITRHTSGFGGGADSVIRRIIREADYLNRNNTLPEMARRLAGLPLAFHPGDQWAYGPSVDVQAYLVEKLSGKPLEEYLQETIFDPLKMTHTGYYVPEDQRAHFAAVYIRNNDSNSLRRMPDSFATRANFNHWNLKPGGYGLTSTIDDYMKFAQMLVHKGELNGVRILKPETVELMATNQLSDTISKRMWLPDRGQMGFGIDFGVRVAPPKTKEENNGVVGEFFWDGAYSTLFWVDPKNKLTAVMFTQLVPYDRVKLHNSFRDAVYGIPVPEATQKE